MPCAAPIRAYKAASGRLVFFKSTDWQYHVEPYTGLQVPCGTCILCREEQARQAAVRIAHEAATSDKSSFVTLTYNDTSLPAYGSLQYKDLTKFLKRARKQFGKLRYYAVGEYGDQSLRPHYHLCIFGHDFTENRIVTRMSPHMLWTQTALTNCWGLGRVEIGALSFETARYTASYVTKKLRSKQRYVRIDDTTGELVAVEQPRAFMSDNLGKQWWIQYGQQLEYNDYVIINGKKQKPPKAYDRWLSEIKPKVIEEIKSNRIKKAKPSTKEQDRARARSAHARVKRKSKSV